MVTHIHGKAGYLFIHNAEAGKTYHVSWGSVCLGVWGRWQPHPDAGLFVPAEITAAGTDVPGSWPQEALGRDWGDGAYWDDLEAVATKGSRRDPRGTGD